jgi:hypothetical protein
MDVGGACLRVAVGVAGLVRGRGPVAAALGQPRTRHPPPSADVAQFLHIGVGKIARSEVLVAAHRFPGGPGPHMTAALSGSRPVCGAPSRAPARRARRSRALLPVQGARSCAGPVLVWPAASGAGGRTGRPSRSRPRLGSGRPSVARSARTPGTAPRPWVTGQPSSTISFPRRSRARGVRAALAWDTKTSCGWGVDAVRQLRTTAGGLPHQ